MKTQAYFIRFLHFIISTYFLGCIIFLYFSLIANKQSQFLYVAIISILIEGIIVFLNQNNCPLGILHQRYGDNKTFFELFFSKKIAKNVVPILGAVALVGVIIYFLEHLF